MTRISVASPMGFAASRSPFTATMPRQSSRSHEQLAEFDDITDLDDRPRQSGWGCGFSFQDPEGNVWDIAFKYAPNPTTAGGSSTPEAVPLMPRRAGRSARLHDADPS